MKILIDENGNPVQIANKTIERQVTLTGGKDPIDISEYVACLIVSESSFTFFSDTESVGFMPVTQLEINCAKQDKIYLQGSLNQVVYIIGGAI